MINYDITLEQIFITLLLSNPESIDAVDKIATDDLNDPQCRQAYAALQSMREEGAMPGAVRLRQRFGLSGETADSDFVGALQAHAVGGQLAKLSDVVEALREAADRRDLLAVADVIKARASDPAQKIGQLVIDITGEIDRILAASSKQGGTFLSLSEAAMQLVRSFDEEPSNVYLPTGFPSIDKVLDGGLPRGEMTIVAGRPSMGKTAMALSIALEVAADRRGVLFFSQEMPTVPFMARVASLAYFEKTGERIPYAKLRPGIIPPEHRAGIEQAVAGAAQGLPMVLEVKRNVSVSQMLSIIRKARRVLMDDYGASLDLVVVDHMGLVAPPSTARGNRTQEMTFISNAMAKIAKDEHVAMVALSQLNRDSEKGDDTHPQLHHLRDSGAIEQDATTVIFPFRPGYAYERKQREAGPMLTARDVDRDAKQQDAKTEYEFTKNILEVNVAKNRNGGSGCATMLVDMAINKMRERLATVPSSEWIAGGQR